MTLINGSRKLFQLLWECCPQRNLVKPIFHFFFFSRGISRFPPPYHCSRALVLNEHMFGSSGDEARPGFEGVVLEIVPTPGSIDGFESSAGLNLRLNFVYNKS